MGHMESAIELAWKPSNQVCRKGDRVRFIDSTSGARDSTLNRGPKFRAIGNIVLSFKDSPSAKVGVQFDKPIPRGINLGGLCEDAHRFFCKADELRLEDTGLDDLENLLVKPLFEVVSSESINSPVILFMKDSAKSVVGNLVSYSTYKSWLEELLDNVVIIGSHAHTNKHKEKVVKRFDKKGKLSPRYVGPYRIHNHFGKVAYELKLPSDLASVHFVFHIPLLKKFIGDPAVIVPLEKLNIWNNLSFKEVPV
ncbi:hypothetical protein FXO38_27364 [Capsicum annuum]|nr:hypothetical protein FXO37_30861 [Capsicum annuum]KAF3630088.1 hypothetical protein FXO38_27364 [Capsicum annuum]